MTLVEIACGPQVSSRAELKKVVTIQRGAGAEDMGLGAKGKILIEADMKWWQE